MTYALVYTNNDNRPTVLQGTLDEINTKLRHEWLNGGIDHDDWEFQQPWDLFGIEEGQLTPVEGVKLWMVPHFEVS